MERVDRAAVVDPRRRKRVDPLSRGALDCDHREGLQAADLVPHPPVIAAGVRRKVRVADARPVLAHDAVSAEDRRLALGTDLGGCKDDVPRRTDRIHELHVVRANGRRLRELHVVDDHLRAVFRKPSDQPRVQRAERLPTLLEDVERLRVDLDDDDVAGRRLPPADRESRVDRAEVEIVEDVRPVTDEAETGHREPDCEEERYAESRAAGCTSSSHGSTLYEKAAAAQARSGRAASAWGGSGSPR